MQDLGSFLESLQRLESKPERNKIQIDLINSGLKNFKKQTEDMGTEEKEIENLNEIINLVESIFVFNRQHHGQGLKILTPNQMLSRLPISLAQLEAGNNSEKLKNEIWQLLYYLYRSKKLTKQLYKNLVDII